MAGTKGKSGGARPGAGRKRAEPAVSGENDALEFLRKVWSGVIDATPTQVRAASAALPFTHPKVDGAKKATPEKAPGKYAVRQGPRLVSSK